MHLPLIGVVNRSPRWILFVASGIVLSLVAGLWIWRFKPATRSCEWEVRHGDRSRAVVKCLASYRKTGDERELVWAAKAHLYLGQLEAADELANQLLSGSRSARSPWPTGGATGDAHGILSYVAMRRGAMSLAKEHLHLASEAHKRLGDKAGLANDAISVSQIAWREGDFTTALGAADEAVRLARELGDVHREVVALMARADALVRMGDKGGASAALATAVERAVEPCDKAWARLKSALCRMEEEQQAGLALVELKMAEQANRQCGSRDISIQIDMNQAWLLRDLDPAGALARLGKVAKAGRDGVETMLLHAYLAADRGALEEAERYLVRASEEEPPDADWSWEVERSRAELFELRGGLLGDARAELHYRAATARVAKLRTTAQARSAFLVASHRAPYDGLIALLARQGRWREVLAVVLELDASDMLRATASGGAIHNSGAPALNAMVPQVVAPRTPAVEDVLAAWRGRELVIAIAPGPRKIGRGRERVYRLHIQDGQVTGADVGAAGEARRWANGLYGNLGDRAAAQALGRLLVPPGAAASTLDLLMIGELGKVPLAALRGEDGALLIGRRPLARVLSLRAARPEAKEGGPSVVLVDPQGNLPHAVREGAMVLEALAAELPAREILASGNGMALPATRERLWEARDAGLLHAATHVGTKGRWRVLLLANGEVDPTEIVQRGLAPRIAVLASCGSAAAKDEEGWGSIAAALLEAGTAAVVASDRSVDDAASLLLMQAFYSQPDWRSDPAHALANAQLAMEARNGQSVEWAAFSALARAPVVN